VSILAVVFAVALASKGTDAVQAQSEVERRPVAAIIFCDLPPDLDTTDAKNVALNVGRLILKFPPGSRVIVYPIDCSEAPRIIADVLVPHLPPSPAERMQKLDELVDTASAAAQRIYKVFRDHYADSCGCRCSCVLNTFGIAAQWFNQFGLAYARELVYFSEMMEECPKSALGKLSFARMRVDSAKARVERFPLSPMLEGVGLGIVVLPDPYGKSGRLPYTLREREEIWSGVFTRAGISRDELMRWGFSDALPTKYDEYDPAKSSDW
jgi:hypothetical protein